jgi:hypothetical protein
LEKEKRILEKKNQFYAYKKYLICYKLITPLLVHEAPTDYILLQDLLSLARVAALPQVTIPAYLQILFYSIKRERE